MKPFHFKYFTIQQTNSALKVGTDSMILGSLCDFAGKTNILDIGSGTGVLSLMIAQRFSPQEITSVEIDPGAYTDLEINLADSPFSASHKSIHGDILQQKFDGKFDGIISNPPFFEDSTKSSGKKKTTARHTDELSFEDLFKFIEDNLSPCGVFWLIVPYNAVSRIEQLAFTNNLQLIRHILIEGKPGKRVRSVLCFSLLKEPLIASLFTVRNENGSYTDEYIDLTQEFHGVDLRKG